MAKKGQKPPFFGEMETSKVFPKYHQKSTQKNDLDQKKILVYIMSDTDAFSVNSNEEEDLEFLMKSLDNEQNQSMLKLNKDKVSSGKNDILQKLNLKRDVLKDYTKKLKQYRYIDDLSDLRYGSYIRWIPLKDPEKVKLVNGGIFCDMKFIDDGVLIVVKNNRNFVFQFKFDESIIFQKLSDQEQILLQLIDFIEKKDD